MSHPTTATPTKLAIDVPPRLTPPEVGKPYREQLTAIGGNLPYSWALLDSSHLPDGFKLTPDGVLLSSNVDSDVSAEFGVQVTDATGTTVNARTSFSTSDPVLTVAAVRRRGVFFVDALMLALAAGGLLLLIRLAFEFQSLAVMEAVRLRSALAIPPPVAGPDWYILAVMALTPATGIVLIIAMLVWYRRTWSRRLNALWGRTPRRALTPIESIPDACPQIQPCPHCARQLDYLSRLLATPRWLPHWRQLAAAAGVKDERPDTLTPNDYRPVANAVFAHLEANITERAVTAGLLVGVGRSRWFDSLTIAASSFEMQLFVLTILGKRPGLRLWLRMLKRTSASLFLNAYLDREDVFALNLMIKRMAWGLQAAAGAADWASEHIAHTINQHADSIDDHAINLLGHQSHFDHADPSDVDADDLHHSMGGFMKLVSEVAMFSFSVGSVALNQLASFVEHWSNALLQGVLAGGILYWHGCDLAADVLAIDAEHRRSAALHRTPLNAAQKVAEQAGEMLRAATRKVRAMYRERRLRLLKGVASKDTLSTVRDAVKNTVAKWVSGA